MSPWIDIDRAVEAIGREYVFSHKPSPGVLAWEFWDAEQAREKVCATLSRG